MKWVKLHGDASNRTYFRGTHPDGSTQILMQLPPGPLSVSEEITNLQARPTELPFLNIAQFLKKKGIPVPEVLETNLDEGKIFLEDLGNQTLGKLIQGGDEETQQHWYQKAIDLLIQLQNLNDPEKSCVAFQRSFDETLLNWEFDHFLEYGIEARLSKKLSEKERETFTQLTRPISQTLAKLPQVFTHRDFQSRNLMVQGERLRLIDFQDALLGPPIYDLVSLLRDSYVELNLSLRTRLIDYYWSHSQKAHQLFKGREELAKIFNWMTIQRKLKDAGRFVYIAQVKKNRSFLPYLPASLKYVAEALEREKSLEPLWEFLKKQVPEYS